MLRLVLIALIALTTSLSAQAQTAASCTGRMFNPISDVCWSCTFPMALGAGWGSFTVANGQEDTTSVSSGAPTCNCANNAKMVLGIKSSFWEPSRIFEAVRSPFCLPALGGLQLMDPVGWPGYGAAGRDGKTGTVFYHGHWYISPLFFLLEIMLDDGCLDKQGFDLGYLTEVDPTWSDSATAFILNPDVALVNNPVAQAACAADCVASTAGFPLNALFWCAGCQGSMYPLSGWVSARIGGVHASTLLLQRMTNKLHREFAMWRADGNDAMCGYYPQPLMNKSSYKYSMLFPSRQTGKIEGRCCQPYGRSSILWQPGKDPVMKENYGYTVFRKRDCCMPVLSN